MAASRGRSSKTAHVLSLLSGASAPEPQAVDQTASAAPVSSEAPASPPQTEPRHLSPPILEVARSSNAALSESIRDALQTALEEELADDETAAAPSVNEDAPLSPEQKAPQPPPSEEFAVSTFPEPDQVAPAPTPPSAPVPETPVQDKLEPINVMELLVEEKLERYIRLFGLCSCPRCLADAKALTLTRLPAKYVVLSPQERMARLSFYQAKYDGDITTQILYACKAVMDFPRHGPEETSK